MLFRSVGTGFRNQGGPLARIMRLRRSGLVLDGVEIDFRAQLPGSVEVNVLFDRSETIRASVADV